MIRKDGDVESYTEASSPTPQGNEDLMATDMVSEAVEEMVDSVEETFTNHKSAEEKKNS
ncbi:hypothetical protein [Cohnella hashimotonis]|uniref:DUF4025 domain-containing protein n=1 Tax=Cohnella hashimotonis TaxID=2826895 RepID=A0ABT6TAL6_9BACL|nr:hypothetical protein [Cohnella hashimotonis]MDI4643879.1 hypothetical protein [Cohnella hashimotonis]